MAEKDIHARYGAIDPATGERAKLMPGDPGYDNIPPTPEQEGHYAEAAEEKRPRAAAKKDDDK